VRITHVPTGIVVSCQDEKSQHKNKSKAMKILRARLYERMREAQREAEAAKRKSMVGTGDRSERIRTYNFPQSRVTDHRIGLTSYRLGTILQGQIDEFVEALLTHDQTERLKAGEKAAS
jgi:peptide chain release factor 1